MNKTLRHLIWVFAGTALLALSACPEDTTNNEPDSGTVTPDVTVTQTECDYDGECEAKLTLQACQVAKCNAGTCEAVTAPAGMTCQAEGLTGDCEVGSCDADGACVASVAPDGQPCNQSAWTPCEAYHCVQGSCAAYALAICDDNNPCTDDSCDPATGECVHANNTAPCDDANSCTTPDTCQDGACVPGPNECECFADADCAAYEDGDACNGTLVCDQDTRKCVVKDGSVVTCTETSDDPCQVVACDPANGTCGLVAAADGTACDDGDVCTEGDSCQAGVCTSGTTDACACTEDTDCTQFDDGDFCNGVWSCQDGHCAPLADSEVDCSQQEAPECSTLACNPATGTCEATTVEDGTACEDGDMCTGGDTCQGGTCVAGTEDACACTETADCADLEDGLACNGTLACIDGQCQVDPATIPACDEHLTCYVTSCTEPDGLCVMDQQPVGTPCDDGNPCTVGDSCNETAECAPGTEDICSCTEDADCAQFDDGDLCNGRWTCQNNYCAYDAATVVDCSDFDAGVCNEPTCNPTTGACEATPVADGTACDDGDVCTGGDSCQAGACVSGTTDVCACTETAECAQFDDGDKCNGIWTCQNNHCTYDAATVVDCSSYGVGTCEVPVCNAATGACEAATAADGATCDDGDDCTDPDTCTNGTCGGTFICECMTDADCAGNAKGEQCVDNNCAPCDSTDDAGCSAFAPRCVNNSACVECLEDADCVGNINGEQCVGNLCRVCDAADNNAGCTDAAAPVCKDGTSCVECLQDTDCAGNANGEQCVEDACTLCDTADNAGCTDAAAPLCKDGTACVECLADADCNGNPNGTSCVNDVCTPPAVDISGWTVEQTSSLQTFTFPAYTTVPEGTIIIIGRNVDQATFEAYWGVTLPAGVLYFHGGNAFPQINGNETYTLKDATGATLDGPTVAEPATGDTNFRRTAATAAALASSWTKGTDGNSGAGSDTTPGVTEISPAGVSFISEFSDADAYANEFVELYIGGTGAMPQT